jgi:general secretion pathway protein D
MRFVAQTSAMNAIILRDTPDRIAIAEKIIEDIDKSKPEVLVDAIVLEVDRNHLRELGILPPSGTTLSLGTPAAEDNFINLRDADGLNSGSFSVTIPDTVAKALATHSTTDLIQNPRVRATDGKLAQIRIGSKVPIPSGSFQPAFVGATGTPVVQFQYIDVGVNLDITPRVLLNREISMVVNVQVSALAGDRNVGGAILPVLSNRQVQHEIRLNEGETNILGGIIANTESSTITGIPGLNQIPILKYLFGQERATRDETEIIIMLTPHVIRMPSLSETNLRGLRIGFETRERITGLDTRAGQAPPPAPPPPPAPGGAAVPQNQPAETAIAAQPTVTLTPSGGSTVQIGLSGNNIFGVDMTFSFDPAAVRIREFTEGGFLSRDGQVIALVQRIDQEAGTARISIERPPGTQAISGNGILANMTLEPGRQRGESILRVTDFRVRNAEQQTQVGRPAEIRVSVP